MLILGPGVYVQFAASRIQRAWRISRWRRAFALHAEHQALRRVSARPLPVMVFGKLAGLISICSFLGTLGGDP